MNLHSIVGGTINTVNPRVRVQLQRSSGYTTDATGRQVPTYDPPVVAYAQIQSLTFTDIQQVSGLNLQGNRRAMYLDGAWEGLERSARKGGDLITGPDGKVWLVAMVLERWHHWVKVAVIEQNNS